jgi:hypothetical protein
LRLSIDADWHHVEGRMQSALTGYGYIHYEKSPYVGELGRTRMGLGSVWDRLDLQDYYAVGIGVNYHY